MKINFIIKNIHPTEYDPLNLPRTVSNSRFSYDQVHPGAKELIRKLMKAQTDHDMRTVIWESFRDLFMDEISEDRESAEYHEAVYDAWKHYIR